MVAVRSELQLPDATKYLCMALCVAFLAPKHEQFALSSFQICQVWLMVQELAHKKAVELAAEARARKQAQPPCDDRPLEDLLSFIGTEPAR